MINMFQNNFFFLHFWSPFIKMTRANVKLLNRTWPRMFSIALSVFLAAGTILHSRDCFENEKYGDFKKLSKLVLYHWPRGGEALRYSGGPHQRNRDVFRGRRGLFKTSACPRFCKRRVLICIQVQSMVGGGGWKSPYNPRNIHGSDAEWLPKWLGFRVCCRHLLPLNRQRIIKSKVKISVPVHPLSVFW